MAVHGAGARNKGKRGEREVIDLLQPHVDSIYKGFGLEPPVLQRNTLQSDSGGHDIVGLDWISLEVKFHETLQVAAWWKQTLEQAAKVERRDGTRGAVPVLFYRQGGRRTWNVMMYVGLLLEVPLYVPAVIRQDDFIEWFKRRLEREVERLARKS